MRSARSEQAALVALLQSRPQGLGWPAIMAAVFAADSAITVWDELTPDVLDFGERTPLDAAAAIARWRDQDLTVVTIFDDDYPRRLRGVHDAPPVLFARGSLRPDDQAVSVVGSRAASERGLMIARGVASALAAEGVTVVAGLALGIDTEAHVTALATGGRTVAVLGTGINRAYPAANARLQDEIATRGLLLSQFWPDAPPQRHTFLMRNATMSGYGLATVVVEAGEQSGARAQARMAVGHGRPVILTDLVVERNDWAKALLGRPGVHVAASPEDVLEVVRGLIDEGDQVGDALRLAYA
ncbi:MAG: DNA-processing protein DprA [Mycobacteriales bacterium]